MDLLRVFMPQNISNTLDDNGVGRVVHAQYRYLPALGIEFVESPDKADLLVTHITKAGLPHVDVQHTHGLYWTGDVDSGKYSQWHHNANALILAASREARAITVPSEWVAMPFRRDMRITPTVIGHGIEVDQWLPRHNQGYVLWNKNRPGDVCSPLPAWELAERGIEVVSTFKLDGKPTPDTMRVIGTQAHSTMKEWVEAADIYLATTKETFGIGTLEAMASGVPILGYAWGGTLDIVEHGVTGWLVQPGDIDGLAEGLEQIRANRLAYSTAAMRAARLHTWEAAAEKYAALYRRVAEEKRQEKRGCSVVITCYNYGQYVGQAIESCLSQRVRPEEIIVVDDGSTDDSREIISKYAAAGEVQPLYGPNQGVAHARNAGIVMATQAHIICLDADDSLDPRYIKTLLPAMQANRGIGIAYSGLSLLWESGEQSKADWPPEFSWESQSQPTNPPSNCIPCAAMFRRDMWERSGGYQQQWAPGEDAEFWTRGLSLGFIAKRVTDEPLFKYRLHSGSASRSKTYIAIDRNHPWMNDKRYPMASPAKRPCLVRSYSEPAVSVIIPVGPGHEKLLPDALDSLLAQTCREWEAIVINDSGNSLDSVLAPYPFVVLVETEGKQGAGKARNMGLERARSPLVLFLDADDWIQPSTIEKALQAHIASGRYVYTGWVTLNGKESQEFPPPKYSQEAWLYGGQHGVTSLVPLEWCKAIGGFDEKVVGWEDWDFFVKLAINGYCGVAVDEPLLIYRLTTGYRRRDAFQNKEQLLALLRERYAEYGTGEKEMAGCCGGGPAGQTILAARRATSPVENPQEAQAQVQAAKHQADMSPVPNDFVRMEFTGMRQGAVTYAGANGRAYRAGRNPQNRFIDVHKDDVDKLLRTGEFRVVQRPVKAEPSSERGGSTSVATLTGNEQVVLTQAEIQAEKAAAMVAIKEEALKEAAGLVPPEALAKPKKGRKPRA